MVALLCALFLLVSSTMAVDTPKDGTKGKKILVPSSYAYVFARFPSVINLIFLFFNRNIIRSP